MISISFYESTTMFNQTSWASSLWSQKLEFYKGQKLYDTNRTKWTVKHGIPNGHTTTLSEAHFFHFFVNRETSLYHSDDGEAL